MGPLLAHPERTRPGRPGWPGIRALARTPVAFVGCGHRRHRPSSPPRGRRVSPDARLPGFGSLHAAGGAPTRPEPGWAFRMPPARPERAAYGLVGSPSTPAPDVVGSWAGCTPPVAPRPRKWLYSMTVTRATTEPMATAAPPYATEAQRPTSAPCVAPSPSTSMRRT